MAMTESQWQSEVRKRIAENEGNELKVYPDSNGIPTIGIGFNLTRDDAAKALELVGAPALEDVLNGVSLTQGQVNALFDYSFAPIIEQARQSINGFDRLSDARRFVIVDLVYNLGLEGWMEFAATRGLIETAIVQLSYNPPMAHMTFGEAADHLAVSAWDKQVKDRATRDVAMMRSSTWVPPVEGE